MGTQLVSKSTGVLADGREIIYFDESPGLFRGDVRDSRDLPPRAPGGAVAVTGESGLRWDPLIGEWVVLAAQRQDRTFLPPADLCPLCPSGPGRPTEIPAADYDVVVFENRFPSLRGAGVAGAAPDGAAVAGLGAQRPAFGRCEVVCFTSDHDASFASLTPRRARTVVEAWADRTAELGAMAGVAQVYCFENRGEEIGVTLHHPHGQVYAFPFVTPRTARMLEQARRYRRGGRRNLFDDFLARELAAGTRVVARNEHWIAFVPAAARWPFEVMLFPAVRVADIPALGAAPRAAFCDLYLDVLRRLDGLFGIRMPYIAAWHQAPVGDAFARTEFGLHLQVMAVRRAPGKLKYQAGTESGMGVWIGDVTPEAAALRLREAR
ncbi:MAG TPA: galactose-1-phosphate uridylyltransferase [Streptosporangiaceae bacterium]|nr:galactose-1-phosphate uridylyltransferase [Streptosporangiaceae bacterium]